MLMNHPNLLRIAVPALAAVLAASGCGLVKDGPTTQIGNAPYTAGSGKVVTESRDLASFHGVSVSRGLTVHVLRGLAASVRVTADDNLLPQITTSVADGRLTVTVEGAIQTHSQLLVEATTSEALDMLSAVSGTTVEVADLDAGSIAVTVSSGSTLKASGKATLMSLTVASGSTANLRDVQAVTAHVNLDSGSTAFVTVSSLVDGTCKSGSTLHVLGHPISETVDADPGSSVRVE
jgi:hypothetical protein